MRRIVRGCIEESLVRRYLEEGGRYRKLRGGTLIGWRSLLLRYVRRVYWGEVSCSSSAGVIKGNGGGGGDGVHMGQG